MSFSQGHRPSSNIGRIFNLLVITIIQGREVFVGVPLGQPARAPDEHEGE
jgi:hypothetical protein